MQRPPSACLEPLGRPPAADRILIVRLSAVGDVIRTLPAAHRIRHGYPGAHLAWLVEPAAASLLRGRDWLDQVLVFPRDELTTLLRGGRVHTAARVFGRFWQSLRAPRFDLVVDFHSILRSGLLSAASGAPMRVALAPPFGRELGYAFATHRAPLERRRISRFARNDGLVDFLAIDPARAAPLRVEREAAARMRARLDGRFAVLHPGSSPSTLYKRYSDEGYAEVARGLLAQHGIRSLVARGPDPSEAETADAIVAAAGGAAGLAPPTATLEDLAALCLRATVFVGSDSGPLHLAALVGTPVVQLLGPTDPVENAPYGLAPSRSVRVSLPCSPCRRGCAAATCMRSISPASVVAAVGSLLPRVDRQEPGVVLPAVAP